MSRTMLQRCSASLLLSASVRPTSVITTTTAAAAATRSLPPPTFPTPASPTNPKPFLRSSSHSPLAAATSGAPPRRRVTLPTLQAMHARGEPITMLTAHDFPTAHVAAAAGMDVVLVGDSLAMVALGLADTAGVTVDEMLLHSRSVARGAAPGGAFVVGDLPLGSYEVSAEQAVATAIRFVKEGHVHAVKLEGGAGAMADRVRAIVDAGIPVLAHVGLTPQRQHALGGFRVQGKSTAGALRVLQDALAVQEAGAFGVVLEAVPAEVAAVVTRKLRIPTIGIGAGAGCSGQVLVQVDMSGFYPPGRKVPKFVKKFGDVWAAASSAIEAYRDEVKAGTFPAVEHTYPMPKEDFAEFERLVESAAPSPNPT